LISPSPAGIGALHIYILQLQMSNKARETEKSIIYETVKKITVTEKLWLSQFHLFVFSVEN